MSGLDQTSVDKSTLLTDRSFLGMTCTQFLGAFNDNLYKQLMLLLAIPVAVAAVAGGAGVGIGEGGGAQVNPDGGTPGNDVQGWATLGFSFPLCYSAVMQAISPIDSARLQLSYCAKSLRSQ